MLRHLIPSALALALLAHCDSLTVNAPTAAPSTAPVPHDFVGLGVEGTLLPNYAGNGRSLLSLGITYQNNIRHQIKPQYLLRQSCPFTGCPYRYRRLLSRWRDDAVCIAISVHGF